MTRLAPILVPSVIAALLYLAAVAGAAVVRALRAGGRRDDVTDQQGARSGSRFTIPVSVIVPATSMASVAGTLSALTRINYPEFEVIVVVTGADGPAFEPLAATWQLDAKEFFYRQSIATGSVRRIYRSVADPRVMVVDKIAGSRADAVNCGVNIARFRYVAVVDPGISFDADALLRLMAVPLRDPAAVLGASSHVERLGSFDRLISARALMNSRLFWRYRSRAFGSAGLVYAWRRDVLLDAKGFSTSAFDPEANLLRRAVVSAAAQGAPARFYRGPEIFGTTSPRSLLAVLRDVGRQQLGAIGHLRLLTPGGIGAFGAKGVAWLLAASILTPLAELWVVAGSTLAVASGAMSWAGLAGTIALLSFGRATVTTAALLIRGVSSGAPDERALLKLVLFGPLEFLGYRPVLLTAAAFSKIRN